MRSTGRDIYVKLCEAQDLADAVNALPIEDLTAVAEHLAKGRKRGIPAQVWGEVEQALTERGKATK